MLCWLLPFNRTEVLLPCEEGENQEIYPHLPEILWEISEGEYNLSDLIFLSVSTSAPPPHLEECTQTKGGLDCHPASTQTEGWLGYHPTGTQTEGGLGYHLSPKLLQEANQARAQLECELIQETQDLAERCEHKWAKQARGHARQRAQMIDQTDGTVQEVFSQVSSTEPVTLLPWCISAVVPFHHISRAITVAAQQDEGVPTISRPCTTVPEPEPHGSPVPGPSGGLTPPLVTSPLPLSSLPDIHWQVLPWWGILLLTS